MFIIHSLSSAILKVKHKAILREYEEGFCLNPSPLKQKTHPVGMRLYKIFNWLD